MSHLTLQFNQEHLSGTIRLEGSKSISNRVLVMQALAPVKFPILNLSPSNDTKALQHILESTELTGDVGAAGTTMRFLTAYFACKEGEKILTGSDRMKNRPIGLLVDALRQLGAEINYVERDGFPPLHIKGKQLTGGTIQIRADVSSQYISALLLCAPAMQDGLTLELIGKVGSFPYIRMTLEMMRSLNIKYSMEGQVIRVEPGIYKAEEVKVESDWSAASYYFSMVALTPGSRLVIQGLHRNSLQGDSVLTEIYKDLGVLSEWHGDELHLINIPVESDYFIYDFSNCPDLAQTLAVTCAVLGVRARFSGLESLRIKETDRTAALSNELEKFNVRFWQEGEDWLLTGKCMHRPGTLIATYDDHRMAMCFAPMAISQSLQIEDADVVAKSYPSFWEDLKRLGFSSS